MIRQVVVDVARKLAPRFGGPMCVIEPGCNNASSSALASISIEVIPDVVCVVLVVGRALQVVCCTEGIQTCRAEARPNNQRSELFLQRLEDLRTQHSAGFDSKLGKVRDV